jgi:hypothetical protein
VRTFSETLGWRKQTLRRLRDVYQAYAEHLTRGMDPTLPTKEAQRVREELWMTARRVKGLGGWLGQFEKPQDVLEVYPAMKPFLRGQAHDLQRPWRYPEKPKRMPRLVLKWLPMVSMWETERVRKQADPQARSAYVFSVVNKTYFVVDGEDDGLMP